MIAISNIATANFSAKAKLNSIGREISQGFETPNPVETILVAAKNVGLDKYLSDKSVKRALKAGADDLAGVMGHVALTAIEAGDLTVFDLMNFAVSTKRKTELREAHDQWYVKRSKKTRLAFLDALVSYAERVIAKGGELMPMTGLAHLTQQIDQGSPARVTMFNEHLAQTLQTGLEGEKPLTIAAFGERLVDRMMPELMTTKKARAMGEVETRNLALAMAGTVLADMLSPEQMLGLSVAAADAMLDQLVPQVLEVLMAKEADKKAGTTVEPQAQPVQATGQHPQIPRVSAPAVNVTEVPVPPATEVSAAETHDDERAKAIARVKEKAARNLINNPLVNGRIDGKLLDTVTDELIAHYRATHVTNTEAVMTTDVVERYLAALNAQAEAIAARRSRGNRGSRG